MVATPQLIAPSWVAPVGIKSAMTTRLGGVSSAPYDALNLGYATQDDRSAVTENERRLAHALGVATKDIRWVYQVHGTVVHHAESLPVNGPLGATTIKGDAIVSHTAGLVCGVKVADCMPVLFAARDGSSVGAAHAGWRGLSGGVLEATIAAMKAEPSDIVAWMGPCIGAKAFEVGEDVRAAFVAHDAAAANHFAPRSTPGKYLCNMPALARQRLAAVGVSDVSGGTYCTHSQPELFFSHRRDAITGRMAAFVWIDPA
jgi:polyphenol oxidase